MDHSVHARGRVAAAHRRRVSSDVVVLLVALASSAVTVAVPFRLPAFTEIGPAPALAADVFATMSALLVAFLAFGRVGQSRKVRHALLGASMTVIGTGTLALAVIPALRGIDLNGSGPRVVTGLLGAALFAAAAWAPNRTLRVRHPLLITLTLTALATAGAVIVAQQAPGQLMPGRASSETFGATADVTLSVYQGVAAMFFGLAAIGAVRRTEREPDVLMAWLGVGAVLAAFSRLHFVFATSEDSIWVLVAMCFRLGFYLLLLGGAAQEIRWYWRRSTEAAVLEERRRIARDLHDGVAQELAFIAAQSRMAAARPPSTDRVRLVASSAQRALDEARRAIAALTRPLDEPLDIALAQEVEEVAGRFDVLVALELQPDVRLDVERREALLRIAREAVTNAGRHGKASRVDVTLFNHDGVTLRVTDDGCGFDVAATPATGRLGLTSMRERAEAFGGTLTMDSREGVGTTVEVRLP